MSITSYSILTASVYFSLFVVLFSLIRRLNHMVFYGGMVLLACLCVLAIVRGICMVEFPFTRVVNFEIINKLYDSLQTPIQLGRYETDLGFVLYGVAILGAVIKLLWFTYRMILDQQHLKEAIWVTDPDQISTCQQVTQGQARMALTEDSVPYIVGFFQPIIFISQSFKADDDLQYILMHEWQHFKNKDQWKKTIIQILTCLFWWHPFVYLLRLEVEQMLELDCDQKVLAQLTEEEREEYLDLIIRLGSGRSKPKKTDSPLFSEVVPWKKKLFLWNPLRLLKQRVWLGTNYKKPSFLQRVFSMMLCVVVVLAFLASYIANFQPRYRPSKEEYDEVASFPAGAVLKEKTDGTYEIIVDGEVWATLQTRENEPFASMPVVPFEK